MHLQITAKGLWRVHRTVQVHPSVKHQQTLCQPKTLSLSQLITHSPILFGNFLRRLVFALASTILYDRNSTLTYPYGEGRASLNGEGEQREEQGKKTAYPLRHVDCVTVRKRNPADKRRQSSASFF
jgi:hypothetical protein